MTFHQEHLKKLKECIRTENVDEWGANMSPRKFVNGVLGNGSDANLPNLNGEVNKENFPEKRVYRSDVVDFVRRGDTTNLEKVLFVLAWGGRGTRYGKLALKSYHNGWHTIVDQMLNGKICRYKAYNQFNCLVKSGKLKGMGPAFFTKLIFFLEPNHNGYIMDQWTARSMNLLRCDDNREIHLRRAGTRKNNNREYKLFWVDPIKNNSAVYTDFCDDLECLARLLSKEPEETEKIIFSRGGRWNNLGCWRRYVLEMTG